MEQGKYFMKKILQIKKEINKNEFSYYSEDKINSKKSKNNNFMMKKICTDLKQSLIHLKLENGYEFSPRKSIKTNNHKFKHDDNNIFNNGSVSPINVKINRENKDTLTINNNNILNNSIKLDDDMSYGQLLNNKNKTSKLELLNNEEIKKNNIKNNNKSNSANKTICSQKSNKSNKSNRTNNKQSLNEKYRKLMSRGLVYDSFDDEEEFEDQINKDFYILPNSIFILILDTLVALSILYLLTYNPYDLASSTKFLFSNILGFRELHQFFIEILFFLDFVVQFMRAYYDFDENLVTNKKKIISHYLSTWFFIDLITIIPTFTLIKLYYEKEKYNSGYDYICSFGCQSDNILHLFSFIKLIKFFKIIKRNQNQFVFLFLSHLSNASFIDNWGSIIFEVILALLALHITACIHIIIGRNSYPNWIIKNNLSESNFGSIYLASIYFLITTLTSVGYGDITGNGFKEHIFQIFLLIIGIIAYSWMVSSISNYVVENNKDNIYFSSKVGILDDIKLSHPEIDNELYNKIYFYLKQLKLQHKKKGKNILLESLPYNLKNALLYEINRPLIERLNFFKNFHNSSFILSAVTKLIPIVTNKGDTIIEQNEIINSMIFVKEGRLGVEIAVDMNNIYNEVDIYLNGTFLLGEEEKNKNKEIEKLKVEQYKRKNAFSLMSTFNYTMDDSSIFGQERRLELNYKKPVSFRKNLLKFMEKKFGRTVEKPKAMNEKRIKYVKLYYIRKGEQFGEIFMFLNKPSSFTLRVKSPKAELLLLKKIDAIEISSNYPNIWKRANKKSFNKLIHLKELVSREMVKFFEKNGIKYKPSYKVIDVKRIKTLPNLEEENKDKKKEIKNNLSSKIKKFQKYNKASTEANNIYKKKNPINIKDNDINNKKNKNNNKYNHKSNEKSINKDKNKDKNKDINESNLRNLDTKKLIDNINKSNNESMISENNNSINQLTPYNEEEINNEIYKGEIFIENINNNINNINKTVYSNESNLYSLFQNYLKNPNVLENKNHKNLKKLIDSSRGKKNIKLHYHKNRKSMLKNNKYNVQYNINNSFNINQIQKHSIFVPDQLSITKPISFKINKIYENLNKISNGNYHKDFIFQNKIKALMEKKYNGINNINNTTQNNLNYTNIRNSIKNKLSRKVSRVGGSFISPKKTFFKRVSKILSLTKETDIKNESRSLKRKSSKSVNTINKEEKDKKVEKDESSAMLNIITQNIIDGEKNLNNPEIFYNELFSNIINNKDLKSTMIIKDIQSKKTIRKGNSKGSLKTKKSLYNNLGIIPSLNVK